MAVLDEDPERPYARDTARPETSTNKRFRSSGRPPECSVHGPQSDAWLPLVSESRYMCFRQIHILGAPQEKRPEKSDSISAILVSPALHVTRTKSFPPLVLFKTKFSASQRVSNAKFFQSPPTGINSSSVVPASFRRECRGQNMRRANMRSRGHQDKAGV